MDNQSKVETFDIIKKLVRGYRTEDLITGDKEYIKCEYNGEDKSLWGCGYLLGQVIRQVSVLDEHKLVSKAAQELWDQIEPTCSKKTRKGSRDINDYYYHEKMVATKGGARIFEYMGASKEPVNNEGRLLHMGDSFIFRDVFHVEHIIPISMIIDRLVELDEKDELNDETINETLNLIYVCRITKQEDRSIKEKCNRSLVVNDVIENVYLPAGIIVNLK